MERGTQEESETRDNGDEMKESEDIVGWQLFVGVGHGVGDVDGCAQEQELEDQDELVPESAVDRGLLVMDFLLVYFYHDIISNCKQMNIMG